ncbi:MAG: excinuclease ABC subunit UvrC [Candidatus Pacearchaeota archaeon]|jgi:excinuclease ABC subunit C
MKIDLSFLPSNPGCYLFLDKGKNIIYIGKAKNLKKRVANYFTKEHRDEKTKALVSNIEKVDFIVTNNEVEAFILENNLIKKNKPKYNIDLRDSKGYAYIGLTNEEFPRLIVARKKEDGKYFGPFTSAQSRDYIIHLLSKSFKLRTCKRLPNRECIRFHIGACSAPCTERISKEDYEKRVGNAVSVLKGETRDLLKKLKKKMKEFSHNHEFELAIELREQINAIKYLEEKQNVERQKTYDEDIVNFIVKDNKVYLMVFNIDKGSLVNKREFEVEFSEDFLEDFLVDYYRSEKLPKRIILPEKVSESIEEFFSKLKGQKVEVAVPQKGELMNLLRLVEKNIEISFFGDEDKLIELKNQLNMQELPRTIEGFDISHLGGTEIVASMVQFKNSKPFKSSYRKFKIKSVKQIDDTAAMSEVVRRRYTRLVKEKTELPDLILIDGGLGQLNAATSVIKELGIKVPVVSLAKREEEVYLPNGEVLKLDKKNKGLLLLIAVRDEAHRFAVGFQRLRRGKKFFSK